MYLQTSRLQYNLQKVGVFQTAHSDKNIQAEACRYIIPQNCEYFNTDLACSHSAVEKGRVLWYNKRRKPCYRKSLGYALCAPCAPALLTASQKCPCKQTFLLHGIIRYRNSGGKYAYLHIHIKRKIRLG